MAATHWKINPDELERLRKLFKLKYPIHIQGSAAKNHHGRYHGLSSYTVKGKDLGIKHHQVSLGCDTPVDRLIETVIHECVHAKQHERRMAHKPEVPKAYHVCNDAPPLFMIKRDGRTKAEKYWYNPKEVEARAVAKRLAPHFPTLLHVKNPQKYIVTHKWVTWSAEVIARSPSAACQVASKRHYGVTSEHTSFRAVKA